MHRPRSSRLPRFEFSDNLRGEGHTENERWREVSRIFAAAAALERPRRDAYLTESCRHDASLRAAVESLLSAHEAAGSFGDAPLFAEAARSKRLAPGITLGTFRIESLIGAGGMGEVYRAHDTRLGRAVAIKVLPDSFAFDPHRRSRFEQEARALAALNHPYIGAIYGVEETAEVAGLVLELVDGPTLADRLAAGPLAVGEIVSIARQIAEGLEAAHDRGIVHRDLKPANIKITPDGVVKVLDFGLAKAVGVAAAGPEPDGGTLTAEGSQAGIIIGTAAYMSPEQARGHPVDRRTDIWAFGCVVFEMCTRHPAFAGATVSETLAAVIEREPDWTRLPPDTPRHLTRLMQRCLVKDSKLRLRDIGEARIALTVEPEAERVDSQPRATRWSAMAAVGLAAASLAVGVYVGTGSAPAPGAAAVSFQVFPPNGESFVWHPAQTSFALSPDGSHLAFLSGADRARVWVRSLANLEPRPLPGTEGALSVFWSPDGRSVAFFADGKLKRTDLVGNRVVTICDVPVANLAHGTWGARGDILFGTSQGVAIMRVAAAGGTPVELLAPNRAIGDARVHWPFFLPGGTRFIYTARRADGEGELRLAGLDGTSRALMPLASNAQWVDPHFIVFVREGVLLVQEVDLAAARAIGEPRALADHVEYLFTSSRAMFSASLSGTIAYQQFGDLSQMVWSDDSGNEIGTIGTQADYENQSARLSPDGRVLLTARREPGLGTSDIWRFDLVRQTEERLTDHRGAELTPLMAEDGRTLVFAGERRGLTSVIRRDLVTGREEELAPSSLQQLVMDVIPGQRAVVYLQRSRAQTFDIYRVALDTGASPVPIVESKSDKYEARVSPDGRAIAFAARDGAGSELYVAPLPVTIPPILAGTGRSPRWSGDSRRLYYSAGNRIMSVAVGTSPSLTVGTPQALFEMRRPATLYDVARDGRFLLLIHLARAGERPIAVATAAVGGQP